MEKNNSKFDVMRFMRKGRFELGIFVILIIATYFLLPKGALIGLYSLLASKVLAITIGVLLAHLLRIFAFPYLSLQKVIEEKNISGALFLSVWYAVIIYAVAVGG